MFFRWRSSGAKNLPGPAAGGCLLAMNHQSYLDPPIVALSADPRPIHFLARKTLLNWPVMGRIFPRLNVVPIDQERPDMSALKTVIKLLRAGGIDHRVPRGGADAGREFAARATGHRSHHRQDARAGGADAGVRRVRGDAAGAKGPRMHPIQVKIGPPLTFTAADLKPGAGEDARAVYQRLSERVMAAITAIEPPRARRNVLGERFALFFGTFISCEVRRFPMLRVLIPTLCGFAGGVIAVGAAIFYFYRLLPSSGYVQITRGDRGPELYKDVEVLEYAPRPQGLYVRFKNTGSKPIEMASFRVRGYKDGKLWAELEDAIYSETPPGTEQEGILKLRDYRDGTKTFDLSDCRIEVTVRYGYVTSNKRS